MVRFKTILLFAAFIGLLVWGGSFQNVIASPIVTISPQNAAADSPQIGPQDFMLDGISIYDHIDKVVQKYGRPTNQQESTTNGIDYIVYDYNGVLDFYFVKNTNELLSIQSRSTTVYTSRNITVGNMDTDIKNAYGDTALKQESANGTILYLYMLQAGNPQLYFEIDPATHQIIKIIINMGSI